MRTWCFLYLIETNAFDSFWFIALVQFRLTSAKYCSIDELIRSKICKWLSFLWQLLYSISDLLPDLPGYRSVIFFLSFIFEVKGLVFFIADGEITLAAF